MTKEVYNVDKQEENKCPRCGGKDVIYNDEDLPTCKKCNEQEYWRLHQEQNPQALGSW